MRPGEPADLSPAGESESLTPARPESRAKKLIFDDFVEARSGALLRYAWLLTADQTEAEDLVQSALIQAWRKWASIRAAPEAYVRRTMANSAARSWRRSQRRRDIIERARATSIGADGDDASDVAMRESVRLALRVLPAQQRAVLILRFFEDLSVKDTAELLGCSEGTVKSATSRALAALRKALPGAGFET